jgi:hypothetical protein
MPEVGRFVNRDVFPGFAENPLSMHKYAYVENSPVNWVDPLGFSKKDNKVFYGPPSPAQIYGPPDPYHGTSYISQGKSVVANNQSVKFKENIFYNDFKGPDAKITYNGTKSAVEANLLSGEAGLGKSTMYNQFGSVTVSSPGVKGNIGLNLSTRVRENQVGLYGKAYLAKLEGETKIPIPFTDTKLVLGAEADFVSLGGGLNADLRRGRITAGLHLGVGGDITIGLD